MQLSPANLLQDGSKQLLGVAGWLFRQAIVLFLGVLLLAALRLDEGSKRVVGRWRLHYNDLVPGLWPMIAFLRSWLSLLASQLAEEKEELGDGRRRERLQGS